MKLSLSQAFAKLGARPENIRYSVSAFTEDGTLVMSLWQHYFLRAVDGIMPYEDALSRWAGNRGNALLKEHLGEVQRTSAPIRAIIARTDNTKVVDAGEDASKIKKEFHILEGRVGSLLEFDGDRFLIHFRKDEV